jgi:hypothetical protein
VQRAFRRRCWHERSGRRSGFVETDWLERQLRRTCVLYGGIDSDIEQRLTTPNGMMAAADHVANEVACSATLHKDFIRPRVSGTSFET